VIFTIKKQCPRHGIKNENENENENEKGKGKIFYGTIIATTTNKKNVTTTTQWGIFRDAPM
jgi:hypothetical protein